MGKNYKRITAITLSIILGITMAGCGSTNQEQGEEITSGSTSGIMPPNENGQPDWQGGAGGNNTPPEDTQSGGTSERTADLLSESDLFTERDKSGDYDKSEAVTVTLKDGASKADASNVTIDGDAIFIKEGGVYVLTGSLSDGQLIVEVDEAEKVQLVLENATIKNSSSAAIYVKQADKVFITSEDGTVNTLETTGEFKPDGETNVDGVIFSKEDVTLNGTGTLKISTKRGHGIVSKDDLKVTGGFYEINTSDHALAGKDSIRICGGTFALTSDEDGLHASNEEEGKGYVFISGGVFTISVGDDGIHAEQRVMITGGTITIEKSYEGIEGSAIDITGGTIRVTSSDDGMNAAASNSSGTQGGMGFGRGQMGVSDGVYLSIAGGSVTVNADGDGLDSNGNLYISGGEVYIAGPEQNDNGALDYNGSSIITGGTLVAAGASGMAQNFGSSSTQVSMLVTCNGTQTGEITVKDESGEVILRYAPEKRYNSVVISCPALSVGKTYTVTMGTESQEVTVSDTITGSGFGMGGHGMKPGGGDRFNGEGGRPNR